ncbi:UNVERIFIED_ORG: hypothetical protein M2438_003751 [Methylobacterium sp. SuP10 SLI 274]|nr:hypothetical protein [Methylorubrum extorquens]MDH6638576.1 hypothetical protein [Methylobacterium sp. SuP10 SLI 274]MDH6667761.1 hypothetical protein [Methylorubrum zatmanii]
MGWPFGCLGAQRPNGQTVSTRLSGPGGTPMTGPNPSRAIADIIRKRCAKPIRC